MRRPSFGAIAHTATVLAAVLFTEAAVAQTPQQLEDRCNNGQQIDACTAAIKSGHWSGKSLSWAFHDRGLAYFLKGDYDRAIADYNEAFRLDPTDADAIQLRGRAYYDKGDHDRAMADYKMAFRLLFPEYSEMIRRNPKDANVLEARCRVRGYLSSDLQGALADCNEALRLAPHTISIFNSRGFVQLKLDSFSQAISDFSAVIADNAKDDNSRAWALYGRGVAKKKSGDTAGGDADIAAAKALKSDIAELYAIDAVKLPEN
jgi:tetratricopeptide (TPR) repeat protein